MTNYQKKIITPTNPVESVVETVITNITSSSSNTSSIKEQIMDCMIEMGNRLSDANEYIIVYGKTSKVHTILTLTYLFLFIFFIIFIMSRIRVFK